MNSTPLTPAGTPSAAKFDPEKALRLRSQALETFQSQNRKVLRTMGGYLVVLIIFAYVCLRLFNRATDVRSWILFGILFLVMVESTILIKLWFWVMNTKLGILREIKVLRMDLALQKGSMEALDEAARIEPPTQPAGVSKWESYTWQAVILALGLLLGFEIASSRAGRSWPWAAPMPALEQRGAVSPDHPETQAFPFVPSASQLAVKLRADTRTGTITFAIHGPDGQLIGRQTGGGLTMEKWKLPALQVGTYTLRVTPNEAAGQWRVQIDNVNP